MHSEIFDPTLAHRSAMAVWTISKFLGCLLSDTPPDGWDGRLRRPIQGSRKALPERRETGRRGRSGVAFDRGGRISELEKRSEFPLGDLTISRRRPHGQRAEVGRHGDSRNRCQPIFLTVRVLRRGSLVCITPHPKQRLEGAGRFLGGPTRGRCRPAPLAQPCKWRPIVWPCKTLSVKWAFCCTSTPFSAVMEPGSATFPFASRRGAT